MNKNQTKLKTHSTDSLEKIKLYKNKFFIVFYDKYDEIFINLFNNVREIAEYTNTPITPQNLNKLQVILYRALKSESHKCAILGEVMRVYIFDIEDDPFIFE